MNRELSNVHGRTPVGPGRRSATAGVVRHAGVLMAIVLGASSAAAQNLGTDAQRAAGARLYALRCAQCHGDSGGGDGPAADLLVPPPRNFTTGVFKFRTTASGELPTDADLRRSIRDGMPHTAMPPWPSLSDREIENLVFHIKTLAEDFAGPFGNPSPLEIPRAPSMSAQSVARGREVFLENQCTDCHGFAGRGNGTSAATLKDQWGHPIRPADLTKRWTFRGGSTREDIFRTFMTGLDGTPMPSYDIQPAEDQWNLVDYVYSLSRDEPGYGTVVVAAHAGASAALDTALFAGAKPTVFPVVGQVIEADRAFHPSANEIEVRAVHGDDHLSLMLVWHDMTSESSGSNGPDLEIPDDDTTFAFSDAVAVQFPAAATPGVERPYFLFGDRRNAVDLWFADVGKVEATHWTGRGAGDLARGGPDLEMSATYDDGRWVVLLRRARLAPDHAPFGEGGFVPVAFSVWDGFAREHGARRGITSWYHLYLQPADLPSPWGPMLAYGFSTLVLGLGATFILRRKVMLDRRGP